MSPQLPRDPMPHVLDYGWFNPIFRLDRGHLPPPLFVRGADIQLAL